MKYNKLTFVLFFILFGNFAFAQSIYSVVTCPAENTKTAMNVSWAADTTLADTYVLYTKANDANWAKAQKIVAKQEICNTYYGLSSVDADRNKIIENARFFKCGATLNNLKSNTLYKYKILSANNKNIACKDHFFKTAGAKNWSACIISDFHSYTPIPQRLESAMAMLQTVRNFGKNDIDWVLHLGDIVAWGGSYSFWKELYAQKPFYEYMWAGLNGNHDNMSRGYDKLSKDFFRDANYNPTNGYEGQEGVCYFFHYGNALFIMLNNEAMHTDEDLAAAQQWVRKVIASQKAKFVIVCEHYQWFYGTTGETSQYGRWNKLFDECGVDLALSGNNHIYVRTNAIFQGKETDGKRGTVYIQTPSSDNERGQEAKEEISKNTTLIKKRWTEGGKTVGAMYFEATPKQLKLTLIDRYGQIIDTAVVKAHKK